MESLAEELTERLQQLLKFQDGCRDEERELRALAEIASRIIAERGLNPARLIWLLGLQLGIFTVPR